jgi:hypothetical protein
VLSAPLFNRLLLPMLLRTTYFCRVNPLSKSFFANLHALAPWGASLKLDALRELFVWAEEIEDEDEFEDDWRQS